MSRTQLLNEELELDLIRETEQHLLKREKEFAESSRRIAQERIERECMMPPLDEIRVRIQRKRHEQIVSRGEVANVRRVQNRSMMLLFMLVTGTLVWWGMQLMQGS
jgi:hypothetical protein